MVVVKASVEDRKINTMIKIAQENPDNKKVKQTLKRMFKHKTLTTRKILSF